MSLPDTSLPEHLEALQALVNRCPTAALKKDLIVMAGCCEVITAEEGHLMITANQVETA